MSDLNLHPPEWLSRIIEHDKLVLLESVATFSYMLVDSYREKGNNEQAVKWQEHARLISAETLRQRLKILGVQDANL